LQHFNLEAEFLGFWPAFGTF